MSPLSAADAHLQHDRARARGLTALLATVLAAVGLLVGTSAAAAFTATAAAAESVAEEAGGGEEATAGQRSQTPRRRRGPTRRRRAARPGCPPAGRGGRVAAVLVVPTRCTPRRGPPLHTD